jgi:sulfatase modifying factor 1
VREPFSLSLGRWSPVLALLTIAACGNRASGVAGSGSSSGTSSGVSGGTVSGTSAGANTGASAGTTSGTIAGSGSSGTESSRMSGSSSSDAGADAGVAGPPSCAPGGAGMTNCGPGGNGTESCCASLEVTGGTYYRTYDAINYNNGAFETAADGGPVDEADPATVSSFRLDKYDVTVGRFRQFVNAVLPPDGGTGWVPAAGSGKHTYLNGGLGLVDIGDDAGVESEPGWVTSDNSNIAPTNNNLGCVNDGYTTWTSTAGTRENLPINCVTWYEAYAFCIWDGGFLPSEAEWEYAAAGGSQQREYPWGTAAPGTACPGTGCQYAIYNCYYPLGRPDASSSPCTGVANIAPVGTASLGAGLWGQLDMAGEVWEWNLDWYAPTYVNPCSECAGLQVAQGCRVLRGGYFRYPASSLLPPSRNSCLDPATRFDGAGFRCARTP